MTIAKYPGIVRNALQDIRYGLRISLRSPGFTIVAVFTLAIGIAASTTVFNWVEMMLLRPIPGASRGSELVSFEEQAADGGPLGTSYRDFRDYRDRLRLISGLTISGPTTLNIGLGDHADRVWGELVSPNFFAVLGIKPKLGRMLSPDDCGDRTGTCPIVVLGYSLWKNRFDADPRVIGTTLAVNRRQLTIVGVAPPDFHGSMPGMFFQLWAPVLMEPQLDMAAEPAFQDRNARMFTAVARLRPGVTVARAQAECASLARRLAETDPQTNSRIGATVLPVRKGHFGGQRTMEGPLTILMIACGVVFLIVCANVANLLLARSTARRKEFSVRMVVGGNRSRMARQLFAESLVLAVMGVVAGVPLAMWMNQSLQYIMPRGAYLPVSLDIPLNGDILWFAALMCASGCLFAGIAPALHGTRVNLNDALKDSGRTTTESRHSQRLRSALVVAEVAMALTATIGAGLFGRSFQMASRIDPGFDPQNVLVAHVDLSAADLSPAERPRFCERLGNRLAAQPGIARVSWADVVPMWFSGNPLENIEVEGYVPAASESMKIGRNIVAPEYFGLMRIPLPEGRDFSEHDTESAQRAMIVNETFASRYFPGHETIGRRVKTMGEWHTIVGVVRDIKYVKPTENAQPYFYVPAKQAFRGLGITVHIRTAGDPDRVVPILRSEVAAIDPRVRVFDAIPMTESISAGLIGERMAAFLLAGLGMFSLALAATGLYSVMAYSVTQRTQEIGVRMALGAQPADVLALVVRRGMTLTVIGLAIGAAAALALTRLAASQLVHVSPSDPAVYSGAILFLGAVSLAANYWPARRATRIDPNDALRCQ